MQKPALFLLLFVLTSFKIEAQNNLDEIMHLIFEKTNALRLEKGKTPFKPLDSLNQLAQYHSVNMVEKGFYSHVDPEGLTPVTRAEKLGIQPWRRVGNTFIGIAENIAKVPWFESCLGLWRHSFSRGLCRLYGRRMEKQSTTLQEHDGRFYLFGSWDFF